MPGKVSSYAMLMLFITIIIIIHNLQRMCINSIFKVNNYAYLLFLKAAHALSADKQSLHTPLKKTFFSLILNPFSLSDCNILKSRSKS